MKKTVITWIICIAVFCGAGDLAYWLYQVESAPGPRLTSAQKEEIEDIAVRQAYDQGWNDGIGNNPESGNFTNTEDAYKAPYAQYSCVTDWDYAFTNPNNSSYVGPPQKKAITFKYQNTGTALGNAWMLGCRNALRTLGPPWSLQRG